MVARALPTRTSFAWIAAVAGALTLIVFSASAGWSILVLVTPFVVWLVGPCLVVLAWSRRYAHTDRSLWLPLGVAVPSLFGPFVYFSMLAHHPHSTDALVFVFVPAYQLIGLAVCWLTAAWFGRASAPVPN